MTLVESVAFPYALREPGRLFVSSDAFERSCHGPQECVGWTPGIVSDEFEGPGLVWMVSSPRRMQSLGGMRLPLWTAIGVGYSGWLSS